MSLSPSHFIEWLFVSAKKNSPLFTFVEHNDRIGLMIPRFDEEGVLPAGVHDATLEEFERRFAINPVRKALFRGLKLLIKDLTYAGCRTLYLNGSFVTDKQEPKDYDACWEAEGVNNKISPILRDIKTYKDERKSKYGGDIYFCAPELGIDFLQFFQSGRDGRSKGILRIDLRKGH